MDIQKLVEGAIHDYNFSLAAGLFHGDAQGRAVSIATEKIRLQKEIDRVKNAQWFTTYTNQKFYPTMPQAEDVHIEDIAHALAHLCRFNGHTDEFYSVAQHSVLVSLILPEPLQRLGLLHDATECYCGDMIRPLKLSMPEYREAEDRIWEAIAERFELPVTMPCEIKKADRILLATERRDLKKPYNFPVKPDEAGYEPLPDKIIPMNPPEAKAYFINRFEQLQKIWKQ